MAKAGRCQSRQLPDVLGSGLWTRNQFDLADAVKRALVADFARRLDGAHHRRKIAIGTEMIRLNDGGILKVATGQTHPPSPGWLHQCGRNRERDVWWWSEARGSFRSERG